MKKLIPLLFLTIIFSCTKNTIKSDSAKNKTYLKAADFRDAGEKDSAYVYYALAKDEFQKINDSLFMAKCLINMAIIQTDQGDHFGGIETSLEAEKMLKKNDSITKQLKSSNYNNLALASAKQENYKNAEKYYDLALQNSSEPESQYIYYNNIANNYLDLKNFKKAKEFYNKSLKTKDSIAYARTLNNLGRCLFAENKNRNVLNYFMQSLKIRESRQDYWGMNSSYATLADYYKEKEPQKALFYAGKMYDIAQKIENPDDRLEALEKLIALEKSENSKKYFYEYQKLNDSLQTARAKARNQFALIRYETEKAKTENIEKENHIFRQKVAIAFLILGLLVGLFWYLRRKKALEQEKEIEVRNTQIKYSKKVHDVVANGLYQTMVEIENNPKFDKEKLLNHIEKLYEESRDITQEDYLENPDRDFSDKFSQMVFSYQCDNHKIFLVGNENNLWKEVTHKIQTELYFVVRELLTNMKKHSDAKLITLKLEKNEGKLNIKYTDNGIGINNLKEKKGSGIKNTENRIESISGEINFEKNPKGGLIIHISTPIL